ncbi:hypothetical protein ABER60_03965 [Heyndrickxia coagulans]|uniref:hypothetical protein n=1 Tax=Heyndrickxia coagulans TaxID=1398 RepID=UPI0015F334EA|nr:hypothetical protein [Heyndrickxia coagulans]
MIKRGNFSCHFRKKGWRPPSSFFIFFAFFLFFAGSSLSHDFIYLPGIDVPEFQPRFFPDILFSAVHERPFLPFFELRFAPFTASSPRANSAENSVSARFSFGVLLCFAAASNSAFRLAMPSPPLFQVACFISMPAHQRFMAAISVKSGSGCMQIQLFPNIIIFWRMILFIKADAAIRAAERGANLKKGE